MKKLSISSFLIIASGGIYFLSPSEKQPEPARAEIETVGLQPSGTSYEAAVDSIQRPSR